MMTFQDFVVTPIYLVLFTVLAYFIRPLVTNRITYKYFIPGLLARFVGALALGLIYQFYYQGGDTFNFFDHGSRWIYEAFQINPLTGLKMLLAPGGSRPTDETFQFATRIWFYSDTKNYLIVKLTAFFDLFTFHTYSATALFFALISFSGLWVLYSVVTSKYNYQNTRLLAIAILFVPSVVFWGSGILKDTVTLGALGWMVASLIRLIDFKEGLHHLLVVFIAGAIIFSIKSYIILGMIPAVGIWIYIRNAQRLSFSFRLILAPILLVTIAVLANLLIISLSSINSEYTVDNVAQRAAVTAYDIRYGWGSTAEGDGGYDIGLPDGTWQGMLRLAPAAINVSLFRPYIWEVRNPLMLLSALESLLVIFLFYKVISDGRWRRVRRDPFLVFCAMFVIIFAFAVGVSSFNFGTLMRYKIPMMPFLAILLIKK